MNKICMGILVAATIQLNAMENEYITEKKKLPSILDNYNLNISEWKKYAPGQLARIGLHNKMIEFRLNDKNTEENASVLICKSSIYKANVTNDTFDKVTYGTIEKIETVKELRHQGLATFLMMSATSKFQETGAMGMDVVIPSCENKKEEESLINFFGKFEFETFENNEYPKNVYMKLKFNKN